jgi:adenylate cyclase
MARAGGATRRFALLIALGVIGLVGGVYVSLAPELLKIVEFNVYDQHFRLRGSRPANPQVAIVAIDEASLRAVGRWPWSRAVQADLVRRLDQAGAAAIAFDVLLNEPERSPERGVVEQLTRRLGAQGLDPKVRGELERMIKENDPDGALAAAIREAERVVLASNFLLETTPPTEAPERQGPPKKSALGSFKNYKERGLAPPIHARQEAFPIPVLLDAAASVGHTNMVAEIDGSTRYEGLIIESRGHYYPSLALEAVRVAAGLDPFATSVTFGQSIQLGKDVVIPIDGRGRVLIDYAGPQGAIPHVSAVDVLQGKGLDGVKDRIVFLGATAEGLFDLRATPVSASLPGVEKHANMAANIIDRRFIVRPDWIELVEAAGIVLLPLLLAYVLPAVRPVPSIGITVALLAALFATAHYGFRQGMWIPLVYPSLSLLLAFLGITIYRILTEERQRMYTRRAFQQYVSPEVVERIMQNPQALQFGGELRNLTVLFSDIRDFTTFTEKNDPQLVVQMLREYLTEMTRIVIEEGGTLDKYIGDAVMAEFGAPIAYPDHALRGCRAALRMAAEVERLTAKWTAEGKEPFRIGLGVNTGNMVVGNLGSEQLFDYTVIGDEVNLGARLESLNKDYQTEKHIIISEATHEAARDAIEVRELGEVKVKGKTRPVVIYELLRLKTTPGG